MIIELIKLDLCGKTNKIYLAFTKSQYMNNISLVNRIQSCKLHFLAFSIHFNHVWAITTSKSGLERGNLRETESRASGPHTHWGHNAVSVQYSTVQFVLNLNTTVCFSL